MNSQATQLRYIAERQYEISLGILGLWGYNDYIPPTKQKSAAAEAVAQITSYSVSKQMSAVLPQEDEVRKYKGKSIKKRADGRFWARYYDKQGKQHSVYGKTADKCLARLKEALRQDKNGSTNINSSITLGEWIKKWLELYKVPKVRPNTLVQMKSYLKDAAELYGYKLNKIGSIPLQSYLNGIQQPRKREKLYTFLKDAFTKAYKTRLIDINPFDAIEPPMHKRKEARSLTHEEEERFVNACKTHNQGRLYLFCLYQGLRIGEAVALTYDDIDFVKRQITVSKSICPDGTITPPKTDKSNRVIPLFEKSLQLLDRNGQGNVFEFNRKTYQNKLAILCRKLEFKNVSVHTMRHTFATRCSEAGIAPKVVQKWLGHSTLDMTLNVYTHVNEDFEQKETIKFDTYFDTYGD